MGDWIRTLTLTFGAVDCSAYATAPFATIIHLTELCSTKFLPLPHGPAHAGVCVLRGVACVQVIPAYALDDVLVACVVVGVDLIIVAGGRHQPLLY